MAVEVRLLEDNQAELANNFFNQVYKTNRSIENFRWEFFDGPKGKAVYVIAIDTAETNFQKIVGIQCAIPIEFTNADGIHILTAKSEDTLVHPEYRGQKLFERMYALLFEECKKAGIQYIWGFTPALKAFERIGFESPFKTTQALLVLKPAKAFSHLTKLNSKNKLSDKFKIFGLTVLSLCVGLKRFTTTVSKNTLEQTNVNNKEAIFNSYYKQTPYYFLRQSEVYLNWRISKNPFGNGYKKLTIW
jgi:GNAT superfamily N-acetyltransferase